MVCVCVCDRVVCERWCVTKLCVCVTKWFETKTVCDTAVCERFCVTKLCMTDGV